MCDESTYEDLSDIVDMARKGVGRVEGPREMQEDVDCEGEENEQSFRSRPDDASAGEDDVSAMSSEMGGVDMY